MVFYTGGQTVKGHSSGHSSIKNMVKNKKREIHIHKVFLTRVTKSFLNHKYGKCKQNEKKKISVIEELSSK